MKHSYGKKKRQLKLNVEFCASRRKLEELERDHKKGRAEQDRLHKEVSKQLLGHTRIPHIEPGCCVCRTVNIGRKFWI